MSRDLAIALTHFAADYHSGQTSRGYRLLCRSMRKQTRLGIKGDLLPPMTVKQQTIYRHLTEKYSNKI